MIGARKRDPAQAGRPSHALPGILLAPLLLLGACESQRELPTYTVGRRDFSHQVTTEGTLRAKNAVPINVPSDVERMARILWLQDEGVRVEAGDVVARFDPTEMEQRRIEVAADLETSRLQMDKAAVEGEVQVSEIKKNHEVASLELDVAQRYQKRDEGVFSRVEIAESEIDEELSGERKRHAEELQPVQEELSQTELELLAVEKRRAELEAQRADEGLKALEVRAPRAGILTWTRDWQGNPPQIGDQVWRGHTLGEIPDLSAMQAEVFVLEADAGGLEVGKPATVVVEAHPERTWEAGIANVEAVAKPHFRGSPVQYFAVLLDLTTTDPEVMKPGGRVRATLRLAEVEQSLVVPRQSVFMHEGEPHVRVLRGDDFEMRRVRLGPQSIGLAVIESGLEEGDSVALSPPASVAAAAEDEDEPAAGEVSGFGGFGR